MTVLFIVIAGCTQAEHDAYQDELICEDAFLRDKQWARMNSDAPEAHELQRQFLSGGKELTSPDRSVWFARARSREFGSCTRDACNTGRCYWIVQIYRKNDGRWEVSLEYQLAPRKVE